jgi:hypothetical protein
MMRARGFWAGLWAGILAAVLLLGAADWHPAGESPHSLLSGAGEVYFPGVEHPDQPVHFDASHPAERPACPVCLHHLRTIGAHLLATALLVPPDLESAMPLASDRVNASGSSRATGARGPPSFS